MRAIGYNRSFY